MHMYIYAGQDSLPESIFIIHCGKMQIMEMLYVHPIADNQSLKTPITTCSILNKIIIAMTRDTIEPTEA